MSQMEKVKVDDVPGGYRYSWDGLALRALVNRITEDGRSKSTHAEIRLTSSAPGLPEHIYQGRLNLTSPVSKRTLRNELTEQVETVDWMALVEFLCSETLRRWRTGQPVIQVGSKPRGGRLRYRLYPILPEGLCTIVYGMGGSFKSYLALAFAILVQSGSSKWGLEPEQGNVLWLDYEFGEEDTNDRIHAICEGIGMLPVSIAYRYCEMPLADDVERIQQVIADQEISLLIVDSVGMALQGSLLESGPAISMMRALRSLRCTSLLIDHMAKNVDRGLGKSSPYGTGYKLFLARSVWEAIAEQEAGSSTMDVGLYHRKTNRSGLKHPIGFAVNFQGEEGAEIVQLKRQDVRDSPELSQFMTVRDQIKAVLRHGAVDTKELAASLGKSEPHIRVEIRRAGGAILKLPDGTWGLAGEEIAF